MSPRCLPRYLLAGLAFLLTAGFGETLRANNQSKYDGSIKIAKLLWKSNAKSAASTLSGTLRNGLSRGDIDELGTALSSMSGDLRDVIKGQASDPRYPVALAGVLLLAGTDASAETPGQPDVDAHQLVIPYLNQTGEEGEESAQQDLQLVLRCWFARYPDQALQGLQDRLDSPGSNQERVVTELVNVGLEMQGEASAKLLLSAWKNLPSSVQLQAVEPMTTSATSMLRLLQAVKSGQVQKSLINTNQLRKWVASENATEEVTEVKALIESVWGTIRKTDDQQRQKLVANTLRLLNSGVNGSITRGKNVFGKVCSQCHRYNGVGYEVGPNIAGNGRGSLPQLVSNVLDPSLVIGEAFQAKTVLTVDDKVISGLIAAESERYLKLKTQGGKMVEFDKDEDIELIKTSEKSLMPEGLEQQLTQQEMIDLFAYLCLLKPIGAEGNELIPGTPSDLVQE